MTKIKGFFFSGAATFETGPVSKLPEGGQLPIFVPPKRDEKLRCSASLKSTLGYGPLLVRMRFRVLTPKRTGLGCKREKGRDSGT